MTVQHVWKAVDSNLKNLKEWNGSHAIEKRLEDLSDVARKAYVSCPVTQEEEYQKDMVQIFGNLKR